jgi:hypothetical protein
MLRQGLAVGLIVVAGACAVAIGAAKPRERDADTLRAEIRRLDASGGFTEALGLQRELSDQISKKIPPRSENSSNATAAILGSFAWYALLRGAYAQALESSELAIELAPGLHWIDANRAHALLLLGESDKALRIYRSHMGERLYANSDQVWEDVIANDFEVLRSTGLSKPAFDEVLDALGIGTTKTDDAIAAIRSQLEQANADARYNELLPLAEEFAELNKGRYGDHRSEYASALAWLGTAKARLKESDEAEEYYRTALIIREKALAPDHPDVAGDLTRLADLLAQTDRANVAEALYRRALLVAEQNFGERNVATARALDTLAGFYTSYRRWSDAEPILKRELAIREALASNDDEEVTETLRKLADLYVAQGRSDEADRLRKRIDSIAQGRF